MNVQISRDITPWGYHNFVAKHYLPTDDKSIAEKMAIQRLLDNDKLHRSSVIFNIDESDFNKAIKTALLATQPEPKKFKGKWQFTVTVDNLDVAEAEKFAALNEAIIPYCERKNVIITLGTDVSDSEAKPDLNDSDLVLTPVHWIAS